MTVSKRGYGKCEKRFNSGRQKKSRDRPEASVSELLFVQTSQGTVLWLESGYSSCGDFPCQASFITCKDTCYTEYMFCQHHGESGYIPICKY